MSSILMDAPTLTASQDNLKDFISFVYAHEPLLKQYGAIKIVPLTDCKEILKKQRMKLIPPSTIQQVNQLKTNDLIYSIDMVPFINQEKLNKSLPINESNFWRSLSRSNNKQQRTNASIVPKMSYFLKRIQRTHFDIHRLPYQSLLRLCETEILHQFTPSLIRAHGSGTIFPLGSARQRLFSLNYNHEGGARYWYILPASERESLNLVLQQQNISVCLEHKQILIDPSMFDKYKIRYHRLVQYPNEMIVLAAGVLSQSFTENSSWSESIDFALPSWLDEGHASACSSPCVCSLNDISLPPIIDISLFRHELVQRYIAMNLTIILDDQPNSDEQNQTLDLMPVYSSISLTSTDQSSCQAAGSSISNEEIDDTNYQMQLEMGMKNNFLKTPNESLYSTTSYQPQTSSDSITDSYQMSSPEDFCQNMMAHSSDEPRYLSFQEIMDLIATPPSTVHSTEFQTIEQSNDDQNNSLNYPSWISRSTQTIEIQNQDNLERKDISKTLFISSMRKSVTKYDIRNHFLGCIDVTIKQSYLPPHLNYAFVLHDTYSDAEYNLTRPINRHLFGSNCRVEYTNSHSNHSTERQIPEAWNIIVRQIPENVTEPSLRNLFSGCQLMKYIPARVISSMKTSFKSNTSNKILWGYAFLYYANSEEAANVVKNAAKFTINERPLVISVYEQKKTSQTDKKQMQYISRSARYFRRPYIKQR